MSALQLVFVLELRPHVIRGESRAAHAERIDVAVSIAQHASSTPEPGAALGEDYEHDRACSGDTKARIVPIEF